MSTTSTKATAQSTWTGYADATAAPVVSQASNTTAAAPRVELQLSMRDALRVLVQCRKTNRRVPDDVLRTIRRPELSRLAAAVELWNARHDATTAI